MANLDSPEEIKKLDSKNISGSIEQLGRQCQQVWDEVSRRSFPSNFTDVKNVVVLGMGGSALGAHVVHSLYFDSLKVSLEIVNGYQLPGYVDCDTLVILSSYSGTTEEVLAAYQEAKAREAEIIVISSGGDLAHLVRSGEVEGYIFEPKFNPSGQPRMGLGYSILSLVAIFAKLGFIEFGEDHLKKVLSIIDRVNATSKIEVETSQNKAKQTASKFFCKIPFLFASEHLVGNIHTFANQINENAKVLSGYFTLPEANHHLIEGLASPKEAHEFASFFFLKSSLYLPRVLKRYDITKKIVEKQGIETLVYEPDADSKLEQVFEFLAFGSWVSFYLAMLYGRDPAPISNVDFLKEQMAKSGN